MEEIFEMLKDSLTALFCMHKTLLEFPDDVGEGVRKQMVRTSNMLQNDSGSGAVKNQAIVDKHPQLVQTWRASLEAFKLETASRYSLSCVWKA